MAERKISLKGTPRYGSQEDKLYLNVIKDQIIKVEVWAPRAKHIIHDLVYHDLLLMGEEIPTGHIWSKSFVGSVKNMEQKRSRNYRRAPKKDWSVQTRTTQDVKPGISVRFPTLFTFLPAVNILPCYYPQTTWFMSSEYLSERVCTVTEQLH